MQPSLLSRKEENLLLHLLRKYFKWKGEGKRQLLQDSHLQVWWTLIIDWWWVFRARSAKLLQSFDPPRQAFTYLWWNRELQTLVDQETEPRKLPLLDLYAPWKGEEATSAGKMQLQDLEAIVCWKVQLHIESGFWPQTDRFRGVTLWQWERW